MPYLNRDSTLRVSDYPKILLPSRGKIIQIGARGREFLQILMEQRS
jgi:hypothetical protein